MGQPHESSGAANLPRESDQSGGDDKLVIVHLSDLHMADDPFNTRFSERYEGYFGHDRQLAYALRQSIEQVIVSHNIQAHQLDVLVTGDLTQCGSIRQMRAVDKFLHGWIDDALGEFIAMGLGLGAEPLLHRDEPLSGRPAVCIPGNHDHWEGNLPKLWLDTIPYSQGVFARKFGAVPWDAPKRLTSTKGGIVLELLSLDSNSGLPGLSAIHAQAGGMVSDHDLGHFERQAAEQPDVSTLAPGPDGQVPAVVRWLLVHHDLGLGHRKPLSFLPGRFQPAPLDATCSGRLLELMVSARIACVLTGHQHSVRTATYADAQVRELRASTAMAGQAVNPARQAQRERSLRQQLVRIGLMDRLRRTGDPWVLQIESGEQDIPPSRHGFFVHCVQHAAGGRVRAGGRPQIECVSVPWCWDGREFVRASMDNHPLWSMQRKGFVTALPLLDPTPAAPPAPTPPVSTRPVGKDRRQTDQSS